MRYRRPVVIIGCCVGIAAIVIWWASSARPVRSQDQPLASNGTTHPATSVVAESPRRAPHVQQQPELVVDPTHELDDIIEGFERDLIQSSRRIVDYAESEQKWREYRRGGGTCWGSEKWMKDPKYYRELGTRELAVECFDRSTFAFTMIIYDDPQFGIIRLKIMHDGFAELFSRPDLWEGLLAVYDTQSARLNPEADLRTIVQASITLGSMPKLYRLPEFKEQIKGRENLFLQAHATVLRRYRDYIDRYDPVRSEKAAPPFFGEPVWIGEVALMLLKQVDPIAFSRVEPTVRRLKWPEKQDMKDIREFLDIVIPAIERRG